MISFPLDAIIKALTRVRPTRNVIVGSSMHLSDEELIKQITGSELRAKRLQLLVSVSRLLRLMDSLISGTETGEGFVAKFSEQWLFIKYWEEDPILKEEFDSLNGFYSDIQLFCAIPDHKKEEPLLFGLEQLRELTEKAYENLKKKFSFSLSTKKEKINGTVLLNE